LARENVVSEQISVATRLPTADPWAGGSLGGPCNPVKVGYPICNCNSRGENRMNRRPYAATAMILSLAAVFSLPAVAGAQQGDDMSKMPGMKAMPGMKMQMDTAKSPAGAAAAKIGNLDLSGGYVRAMLPGQPVGGGYVSIHNGGGSDDRLVSVESPTAGKVELHEMTMQGDVMKMRELKDGIAVPAGATVTLSPNTLHMMFKQVKTPFKKGAVVPVTLSFEKAGAVDLSLPVVSAQGK
jgi:periplasmic copper chaperone A